jgi:hypothetical protein
MFEKLGGAALVVLWLAYLALGLFQIAAFMQGMETWWGLNGFVAIIIGLILLGIVPFGSIIASALAFYGAYKGWHWQWWQAALLCFPFVILSVVLMGGSGLASLAQRRFQSG